MRSDSKDDRITLEEYKTKFKNGNSKDDNQGSKDVFTNVFDVANEILYE